MDAFLYRFPVSGVETYIFLPPVAMFLISALTSMGGVSGAFILVPFQMSVLGYTQPGVSATSFVYNIVAIPLGVYRHIRDGRFSWALFGLLTAGTLPGVLAGYYVRIHLLPDPRHFKPFVGIVLGVLALQTLYKALRDMTGQPRRDGARHVNGQSVSGRIGLAKTGIVFEGKEHAFATVPTFLVALLVGVVGGAYGIGGGAVLALFCVSVLRLPVRVVAGTALLGTWITSVLGALLYAYLPVSNTVAARPDWLLGGLFGLGGMAGIYVGARLHKYVPEAVIRLILAVGILAIAVLYIRP